VEKILPALEVKADLAVCDPPRAGLHPRVIDALAASTVTALVYISCDPATLARDLRRLGEKGFAIESIALFDMFPQTYHFETVVLMTTAAK
jgi:23S rRNA (uracil1939-C5)-methyltransferase